MAGFCTPVCIDDGWAFETVEDACDAARMASYTRPARGYLECTACRTDSGGAGGGGGGGVIVPPPPSPPPPPPPPPDDCGGITQIAAHVPDPEPLDTDNLTAGTGIALQCLRDAVADNGGDLRVISGYRSQAYQDHLREVWDKYQTTSAWPATRCPEVRENVREEWNLHRIGAEPADVSPHSSGTAFDARWGTLDAGADIDDLARGCGLSRPLPVRDRRHFVLN